MKKTFVKGSNLIGVQAIYRNGELIYEDQQIKISMKNNQMYKAVKKEENNNQRHEN
ncbi:MAG: hypothetical protein JXB42_09590 [Deltaproteobacteria bacterium]|nr:hypothetical protein [Deltaproteobacteria bacterium]